MRTARAWAKVGGKVEITTIEGQKHEVELCWSLNPYYLNQYLPKTTLYLQFLTLLVKYIFTNEWRFECESWSCKGRSLTRFSYYKNFKHHQIDRSCSTRCLVILFKFSSSIRSNVYVSFQCGKLSKDSKGLESTLARRSCLNYNNRWSKNRKKCSMVILWLVSCYILANLYLNSSQSMS